MREFQIRNIKERNPCASAVIFKARLFEQLLGKGLKSKEKTYWYKSA